MRLLVVPGDSWPGPGREVSVQPAPSLASLLERVAAQLGIRGEITGLLAWDEDFEEWIAVESLSDEALTGETVPRLQVEVVRSVEPKNYPAKQNAKAPDKQEEAVSVSCREWSETDVAAWVRTLDIFDDATRTQVAGILTEQEVDGETLALYGQSLVEFELLVQRLSLKVGKAAKLWRAVQALLQTANPVQVLPPAAAKEGVPPVARAATAAPKPPPTFRSTQSLVVELEALGIGTLSRRAEAAGADEDCLLAAQDGNSPKAALIALIVELTPADPLETLKLELSVLGIGTLSKRARESGVDDTHLLEAQDSEDPKPAIIALILENSAPAPDPVAMLRLELEGMGIGTLSKRAKAEGVDEQRVMEAQDSDEPKPALLELILDAVKKDGLRPARAHFRSVDASPIAPASSVDFEAAAAAEIDGPHVMLSYQWDEQEAVVAIRQRLTQKQIKTWMDIDGGMKADLYDSMAEGVQNAVCVLAFMTQQYEDSPNCKSELKFARDRGVPIVPIMFQGGGWRAGGWLGLITAGALWIPFVEPAQFENNVSMLVQQIGTVSGLAVQSSASDAAAQLAPMPAADSVVLAMLADDSVDNHQSLAVVPAEVPHLSANVRKAAEMDQLKALLLDSGDDAKRGFEVSSQKKSKTGLHGMGGIGKTVMAAWIARDLEIRAHFDLIIWVTCSQDPNVDRLLQLMYLQATGKDLAPGKAPEEVRQMVSDAVADKNILLIIDDVWNSQDETALNIVDCDSAGASRVLVTTRIRGLLHGGAAEQVEIGLPSMAAALGLLCQSAGLGDTVASTALPTEASEVVEICGRLPLALDIAGRLITDMGLELDWKGVPQMLRQEMAAASGGETSLECRIISTSMNAIAERDRQGCREIFAVLATVAEDTHVPPDAFYLMFSEITAAEGPVPHLQLRKWMQLLINRSLILNNWERPQLHDIVREWAISQHTPEELAALQCRVVGAFVRARPPSQLLGMEQLKAWQAQNECALYVRHEIGHHIRQALSTDVTQQIADCKIPACVDEWMAHIALIAGNPGEAPKDCDLLYRLCKVLGRPALESICRRAEADLTKLRNVLLFRSSHNAIARLWFDEIGGAAFADPEFRKMCIGRYMPTNGAWLFLDQAGFTSNGNCTAEQFALAMRIDLLNQGSAFVQFLQGIDPALIDHFILDARGDKETFARVEAKIAVMMKTQGSADDRERYLWTATINPQLQHCMDDDQGDTAALEAELLTADNLALSTWQQRISAFAATSAESDTNSLMAYIDLSRVCPLGTYIWSAMHSASALMRLPTWDWSLFAGSDGDDMGLVMRAFEAGAADMDALEGRMANIGDALSNIVEGTVLGPLCILRGALTKADRCFELLAKTVAAIAKLPDNDFLWVLIGFLYWAACPGYSLILPFRRRVDKLLEELPFTASDIPASLAKMMHGSEGMFRTPEQPRPSKTPKVSSQMLSWQMQAMCLLRGLDKIKAVEAEAAIAALPSADEMMDEHLADKRPTYVRMGWANAFLLVAEIHARQGQHELALGFLEKVLRKDLDAFQTESRPAVIARAHTMRGASMAALGRLDDAATSLEAAASLSDERGMYTLQLLALKELHDCVLVSTPRAAGFFDRRVAPVLKRVVASKEMLREVFEGSALAVRLGA